MRILLVISSLLLVYVGGASAEGDFLFEDSSIKIDQSSKRVLAFDKLKNIRTRYVTINLDVISALNAKNQPTKTKPLIVNELKLNLFSDVSYVAVRNKLNTSYTGNTLIWRGDIKNMRHGQVTLAINENIVSGHITTDTGDIYEIRYMDKGVHAVVKVNQFAFLPDRSIPVYLNAD